MNFFGLQTGLLAVCILGLGFPLVIYTERWLGALWWPYMMGLGLLLILTSIFLVQDWVSILAGLSGAMLVWGSTELKNQARRASLGWFPFHARKLLPPFAKSIQNWPAPHL